MEGFCPIKEIDLNREVLTLKLLKDKRLAAGNNFGKLNIYNLDNYQPDIIIEGQFNKWITNIIQISNGDLIVSSQKIVKIIKITKNTFSIIQNIELTGGVYDMGYGCGGIYLITSKIIELNNKILAISIYRNNLIQLWKKDNGFYFNYDNLIEKEPSINEIFEINPNYLLSDNDYYKHLVIWDIKNKQKKAILKGIKVNTIISDNKTSFINKKVIAYCGNKYLYIIEINKFFIFQIIKLENDLISICLFSKNILFIGNNKGILYQFEIDNLNFRIKDKNKLEYKEICSITKIDDNRLAIGFCKSILLILKNKLLKI